MEITARKGIQKDESGAIIAGQEVTVDVDLGSTIEELAANCEGGMATVYEKALSQIVVDIQARCRALMTAGMSDEAIQTEMATYVPGAAVRKVAVDAVTQLKNKLPSMSEEEKAALIALLKGNQG